MQLPTEKLEITSHRPVFGWFIAAYKKIIHMMIGPYLRNVFEKEHAILNNRFVEIERQAEKIDDLIKRAEKIDDLIKRQEDLDSKLATLRYRFEYYINTGKIETEDRVE